MQTHKETKKEIPVLSISLMDTRGDFEINKVSVNKKLLHRPDILQRALNMLFKDDNRRVYFMVKDDIIIKNNI